MTDPTAYLAVVLPLGDVAAPVVPGDLVGPVAGLAIALVAIFMFITEKIVPGSRLVRAEAALGNALEVAERAVESQKQMAAALEQRNVLDLERIRLIQAGLMDDRGQPIPRSQRSRA